MQPRALSPRSSLGNATQCAFKVLVLRGNRYCEFIAEQARRRIDFGVGESTCGRNDRLPAKLHALSPCSFCSSLVKVTHCTLKVRVLRECLHDAGLNFRPVIRITNTGKTYADVRIFTGVIRTNTEQ